MAESFYLKNFSAMCRIKQEKIEERGGGWVGGGMGIGYWVLGIGYWVLGIGYWVLVFKTAPKTLNSELRTPNPER
jgi:hypothetical protein